MLVCLAGLSAGQEQPGRTAVEGIVRDSATQPVPNAVVTLREKDQSVPLETKTDAAGRFEFAVPHAGAYTVTAKKSGFENSVAQALMLSAGDEKHLELVLHPVTATAQTQTMEFSDQPDFTVAGVTDWTNVGGHGADTTLRASEALAKETRALKTNLPENASQAGLTAEHERELRATLARDPGSFEANRRLGEFCFASAHYRDAISPLETAYRIDPTNRDNAYHLALAYQANGDLERSRDQARNLPASGEAHRLVAELDEELGDPLAAEQEYERAAQMDPSEQNYFEWGTELLLHRAIQPAAEVFSKGVAVHPNSSRMLAGLGVARYASGAYEEAARCLCEASDLKPDDATAYLFLGKMEKASAAPLGCSEQKLARFVHNQPRNALANYYYAMSLWKRERRAQGSLQLEQVEELLKTAVETDPKFDEAYLQLGILYSAEDKPQAAIQAYQKAIELSPRTGEAHYRLGLEYKRTGDAAKAQQEFQLHEQAEKAEAATIENQRRELRQFVIILKDQPASVPR
jgi:tetratricopeptide (TPR) repeat protein